MGTMLILIGLFDLLFGAALTALTINLAEISGELESKSTLISLGSGLSQLSGGLISLGSAAEAAAAKAVLRDLPPIWLSMLLAIGRVLLSLGAICLGAMLSRRMPKVLSPLKKWSVTAVAWGAITILATISIYRFIGEATGGLAAFVTVLFDLGLHIVWPACVFMRVRQESL